MTVMKVNVRLGHLTYFYSRVGSRKTVRSRPEAGVANNHSTLYLFFIFTALRLYIMWDKLNLNFLSTSNGGQGCLSSPSSSIMASFDDSIDCLSKYTYLVVVVVIWFGWVTEKQEAD